MSFSMWIARNCAHAPPPSPLPPPPLLKYENFHPPGVPRPPLSMPRLRRKVSASASVEGVGGRRVMRMRCAVPDVRPPLSLTAVLLFFVPVTSLVLSCLLRRRHATSSVVTGRLPKPFRPCMQHGAQSSCLFGPQYCVLCPGYSGARTKLRMRSSSIPTRAHSLRFSHYYGVFHCGWSLW